MDLQLLVTSLVSAQKEVDTGLLLRAKHATEHSTVLSTIVISSLDMAVAVISFHMV